MTPHEEPEVDMVEPGVVVRPATRGDLASVHRISVASHSTTTSPGPGPDGPADDVDDPPNILVATIADAVVGYVQLERPTPLESNQHVWMLTALDVAPEARRRGVGRALVEAVLAEVRRRGGSRIRLRVLGRNGGAIRFYQSVGFQVEGVLRGEFVLDGLAVDDVLMAIHLGARPGPSPTGP